MFPGDVEWQHASEVVSRWVEASSRGEQSIVRFIDSVADTGYALRLKRCLGASVKNSAIQIAEKKGKCIRVRLARGGRPTALLALDSSVAPYALRAEASACEHCTEQGFAKWWRGECFLCAGTGWCAIPTGGAASCWREIMLSC